MEQVNTYGPICIWRKLDTERNSTCNIFVLGFKPLYNEVPCQMQWSLMVELRWRFSLSVGARGVADALARRAAADRRRLSPGQGRPQQPTRDLAIQTKVLRWQVTTHRERLRAEALAPYKLAGPSCSPAWASERRLADRRSVFTRSIP